MPEPDGKLEPRTKTVAIIQGRMGSSRLPGKVLLDIAGKPMLQHVLERTQRARSLDQVVVATSSDPSDDPIADFCLQASIGVVCSRGSLHDVLDRYYQAALTQNAKILVRITADCPMIDPDLIDETVKLVTTPVDFAANRLPPPFKRTFPIGLDVEACTFDALERAWLESKETFHREHVMPYLYEGVILSASFSASRPPRSVATGQSPRGFNIAVVNHEPDHGSFRWTVDTPEDLTFAREVFARLNGKPEFTWYDILEIIRKEPELAEINAEVRHKTMTEVDERAQKSQSGAGIIPS
jgi:spore coat polysaccharide biosynthesis protein SpsF